MPHAGQFKLKPLHKQENRLPMSRGVNKNNRKQFEQNWDRICKRLFERIKAGSKGGKPGQWSARKAQLLAKQYKAKGGGYK